MTKKIISRVLPILFCIVFIYARIYYYGYINDSVAVQDTESYFEAAAMGFPKLEFFEQQRSATVPLYYKIMDPSLEHEIVVMSEPYFQSEPGLEAQPGTEVIIAGQLFISILCWVILALIVSSCLHGWFAKAVGTLTVLMFAFVPQVADWDSILSSESLSFSLFALMLGFLLKVIPTGKAPGIGDWFWGVGAILVSALWIFTRDTNGYFLIIAAVVIAAAGIIWWILHAHLNIPSLLTAFCLIGLFFFQQQTFHKSRRWELPLLNNLTANVFPYADRVAFFEKNGMPVTEDLLSQTGSAEYNALYENELFMTWVHRFGMRTYQKFLLDYPIWAVSQIWNDLDSFFNENIQPFFYGRDNETPHWAKPIGDLFHSKGTAVILADLILIFALFNMGFRTDNGNLKRWMVFCLFLFLGGGVMMCVAYLGEVRSIWRHVLSGVMALRLCAWMSLLAFVGGFDPSEVE